MRKRNRTDLSMHVAASSKIWRMDKNQKIVPNLDIKDKKESENICLNGNISQFESVGSFSADDEGQWTRLFDRTGTPPFGGPQQ